MSLKRVGVLLRREFLQGPKSFIFILAVVAPIVISLVLLLIFGTLFAEKPNLGIVDEGDSQLVTMAGELTSITTIEYDTVSELKQAVESGALDIGIVLPEDFDDSVTQGEEIEITAYVWGESLAQNRIILGVTIINLVRDLAGQEAPVEIAATNLGDEVSIPWADRILPLIVLMAVFIGGVFIPATSVVNEKEKKTIEALVVTPTTIGDVIVSKGILGIILSLFMGIVILALNQAFGAEPALLVLVMTLGAIMAAEIGLLLGVLMKDTTSLFAIAKFGGILLYAPAIIYLFPQIPEWVGMLFPTYYFIEPIVDISLWGAGWPEIATNVFILIGLDLALIVGVILVLRRTKQYAV